MKSYIFLTTVLFSFSSLAYVPLQKGWNLGEVHFEAFSCKDSGARAVHSFKSAVAYMGVDNLRHHKGRSYSKPRKTIDDLPDFDAFEDEFSKCEIHYHVETNEKVGRYLRCHFKDLTMIEAFRFFLTHWESPAQHRRKKDGDKEVLLERWSIPWEEMLPNYHLQMVCNNGAIS